MSALNYDVSIGIQPVIGGFIVTYPAEAADDNGVAYIAHTTEIATTVGKAMRIAKKAVEAFSKVKPTADDAAD